MELNPGQCIPQSLVDLLVPQGVDNRVQNGCHYHVHKSSLSVGVQPACLLWLHVYKYTAAIHQREDYEMRGAGRKSSLSLPGRRETHYCDHYIAVCKDGYHEGSKKHN